MTDEGDPQGPSLPVFQTPLLPPPLAQQVPLQGSKTENTGSSSGLTDPERSIQESPHALATCQGSRRAKLSLETCSGESPQSESDCSHVCGALTHPSEQTSLLRGSVRSTLHLPSNTHSMNDSSSCFLPSPPWHLPRRVSKGDLWCPSASPW